MYIYNKTIPMTETFGPVTNSFGDDFLANITVTISNMTKCFGNRTECFGNEMKVSVMKKRLSCDTTHPNILCPFHTLTIAAAAAFDNGSASLSAIAYTPRPPSQPPLPPSWCRTSKMRELSDSLIRVPQAKFHTMRIWNYLGIGGIYNAGSSGASRTFLAKAMPDGSASAT